MNITLYALISPGMIDSLSLLVSSLKFSIIFLYIHVHVAPKCKRKVLYNETKRQAEKRRNLEKGIYIYNVL